MKESQIESTLTTKKYVHPDRPDIFVEVDVSTGNANVGLVDPDAGAFAYTDEDEERSTNLHLWRMKALVPWVRGG